MVDQDKILENLAPGLSCLRYFRLMSVGVEKSFRFGEILNDKRHSFVDINLECWLLILTPIFWDYALFWNYITSERMLIVNFDVIS